MPDNDLKKAGLKITLPRLKILEILENSKARHLSAEDVYRSLTFIAFSPNLKKQALLFVIILKMNMPSLN
jgi:Fe2+ or Zn2+ uptake regulation protein